VVLSKRYAGKGYLFPSDLILHVNHCLKKVQAFRLFGQQGELKENDVVIEEGKHALSVYGYFVGLISRLKMTIRGEKNHLI